MTGHDQESRVGRAKAWAHNQPLVASIVIAFGVIVALGAVIGAINTIATAWDTVRTPPDPRIFELRDQTIRLAGGNGMTFDQAIIVDGAFNTDAGVRAEYAWIERFYGGFGIICHALVRRDAKRYDVFVLRSEADGDRILHFDVTHFFGTPDSEAHKSQGQVEAKTDLYTPNPQTIRERNANECASIEGVVSLTAAPSAKGYNVK